VLPVPVDTHTTDLGTAIEWSGSRGSAKVGYFPKIFGRVTRLGAPIAGMLVITSAQSLLALLTISPSLTTQFVVLVNLAVVTNLIPYLLSMGALPMMQAALGVARHRARAANVVAVLAGVYSLYALYSAGYQAVMWGAIVTFAGWILFGLVDVRLTAASEVAVEVVPAPVLTPLPVPIAAPA